MLRRANLNKLSILEAISNPECDEADASHYLYITSKTPTELKAFLTARNACKSLMPAVDGIHYDGIFCIVRTALNISLTDGPACRGGGRCMIREDSDQIHRLPSFVIQGVPELLQNCIMLGYMPVNFDLSSLSYESSTGRIVFKETTLLSKRNFSNDAERSMAFELCLLRLLLRVEHTLHAWRYIAYHSRESETIVLDDRPVDLKLKALKLTEESSILRDICESAAGTSLADIRVAVDIMRKLLTVSHKERDSFIKMKQILKDAIQFVAN